MAVQFSTILTEARGLVNDPTGAIYKEAPMITLGNKVYRELQTKVAALGAPIVKEQSAIISVPEGTLFLGDGALLPTDFLQVISMDERPDGSTSLEDFRPMDELDWEPDVEQTDTLRFWSFREEQIKFPGATVDVDVRLKYYKSLGTITSTTSLISILNCESYLSQRLAVVAALVLGHNPSRSKELAQDMVDSGIWDDFKATIVKPMQRMPVRRRRTRYRVP